MSELGATPKLHIIVAPAVTTCPMSPRWIGLSLLPHDQSFFLPAPSLSSQRNGRTHSESCCTSAGRISGGWHLVHHFHTGLSTGSTQRRYYICALLPNQPRLSGTAKPNHQQRTFGERTFPGNRITVSGLRITQQRVEWWAEKVSQLNEQGGRIGPHLRR